MMKFFKFAGHIGLYEGKTGLVKEFRSVEECSTWVKANVIGGKVARANETDMLTISAIKGWSF